MCIYFFGDNMVKARIVQLEDLEPYELVDASATVMKEPHKRFGQYAKRIAEIIKQVVNPPKMQWQPWWTIGTRVFTFAYKGGHSEDVCVAIARELAREAGVDEGKAEELAKAIKASLGRIVGEKARTGVSEEAGL
jgi:hypothetical protein